MAGEDFGENAQIHERGSPDLQPMRRAASVRVDIKTKFALGVFSAEINLTCRYVGAFSVDDEMMEEIAETGEDMVRKSLMLEQWRDKAKLIYRSMVTFGVAMVEDAWKAPRSGSGGAGDETGTHMNAIRLVSNSAPPQTLH